MVNVTNISTKTIAIATVVILIGIMLFSGFTYQPQLDNATIIFKEEPLEKNTELQLHDGEQYVYSYVFNNTPINMTYQISKGNNCTIIRFVENLNRSDICLDKWGVEKSGSNVSFGDGSVLLFKPWMLALHEGWHWNTSMYMQVDNTEYYMIDAHYRVMRIDNYRGRESFVVEIKTDDAPAEYQWVDKERRVLLKIINDGYMLEMVDGLVFSQDS
ncbi:hypothetical protein KKB44_05700 [Candidatus Micrarchaeota archaeon]|nr:hypothetical protein [Candidatus Micrarchaeota archaeon]